MDEELVDAAAGLDLDGDEPAGPDESEDGGKADFVRMCKAIQAGKFEEAWGHYQACAGMDTGDEPAAEPAPEDDLDDLDDLDMG
jgi:hypothetical protein